MMNEEICRNCRHCTYDSHAPLVYCAKRGEFITPHEEENCGFFMEKEREDKAPSQKHDGVTILHDFSIHGLLVCDDTDTAISVIREILRESPTLQKVYRRMTTHKIVIPSDEDTEEAV